MKDLLKKCLEDFDSRIEMMEQSYQGEVEHKEHTYRTELGLSHKGGNNWEIECILDHGIPQMKPIKSSEEFHDYDQARSTLEETVKKYKQ